MSTSRFKKATREARNARIALDGPSGSGKTFTALNLARFLGKRIAVIDTEHSSASTYAPPKGQAPDPSRGWFDFASLPLETHAPQDYIDALYEAAEEGFDVVIVDSLSHAWMGKGGVLQQVDDRGGKFEAWKFMAPQQQALMEAILTYPGHVFVTLRTKTAYDVSKDDKGKTKVEKTGTAPVQKDGMEYEFDIVIDMDIENNGHVSKTRCMELAGSVFPRPGEKLGRVLRAWCETGGAAEPAVPPAAAAPTKPAPTPQVLHDELVKKLPAVAAEAAAVLTRADLDDEGKRAELRRIHARAKLAAAVPAPPAQAPAAPPDPADLDRARKLFAAAHHADPSEREEVAKLLREYTNGSGKLADVAAGDLGPLCSEVEVLLNARSAA